MLWFSGGAWLPYTVVRTCNSSVVVHGCQVVSTSNGSVVVLGLPGSKYMYSNGSVELRCQEDGRCNDSMVLHGCQVRGTCSG